MVARRMATTAPAPPGQLASQRRPARRYQRPQPAAAAVKKCPGAKLVGLWNRSQDRAKQRAGEFGCKNYATPEELVKDPAIQAVFVLTNLESHLEYTKLALDHGKHVLVEKPVGVSV